MLSLRFFRLLAAALTLTASNASAQSFFWTSFEPAEGYPVGAIAKAESPWVVDQPPVLVGSGDSFGGRQAIQIPASKPFGQFHLSSKSLAGSRELFVDFFARVFATTGPVEFVDFDGALLAFVKRDDQGEFFVFHSSEGSRGNWIATGQRYALGGDGRTEKWLRVTIQRNFQAGTWNLYVNSGLLFYGVRSLRPDTPAVRTVFFAGFEDGDLTVDDFYIGEPNPFLTTEIVEPGISSGAPGPAQFPQIVGPNVDARKAARMEERPILDLETVVEPRLKTWSVEGRQGGETTIPQKWISPIGQDPDITAFASRFDDNGNPLPMEITLRADVEIKPGVDLRRVHWEIRRLRSKLEGPAGELLASGGFAGSLVHKVTIPGKDVIKGMETAVFVK